MQLHSQDTISQSKYRINDFIYRRALLPRFSFASTSTKVWWLFPQSKLALIRRYLPRETSQTPQLSKHDFIIYSPVLARNMDRGFFYRWLVFLSAALSQSKAQSAKSSSICKSSWQIFKSHDCQICIHPLRPLNHLANLSWFLSRVSKGLSIIFTDHELLPPGGMSIGVGVYWVASWDQGMSRIEVLPFKRGYNRSSL